MSEILFLMWLHLKNTVSPGKAQNLIKHFGSPEKVYLADKKAYQEHGIANGDMLRQLMDKNVRKAEGEINAAKAMGITLLGYGTEDYPSILYEIPDPPLILYVKGDVSVLHKRNIFCIVGTRHCSAYGASAAFGVAEQLGRCGMIVLSGVAMGIDSAAHRGAVRGGGQTIGIMGCGLDVEYPAENPEIRRDIITHGALISEFPLGTPPYGSNFPIRNRLLSAFSLGVAVMEARERSGALITAKYAAEQGRDVFALPGNISNPLSVGTNRLIQDGAALLTGADVILAEYLLRYPEFFSLHDSIEAQKEREEKPVVSEKEEKALNSVSVTEYEKTLYKVLTNEPLHVDELSRISGLPVKDVMSMITMLQIKGKIKEHSGNRFSL